MGETMSQATPDFGSVITAFENAIVAVLTGVANWLQSNASVIVSIGLGIAMAYFLYRQITRLPFIRSLLGKLF